MDTANRFVLTDVERNIASESVRIDEGVLSLGAGQDWSVEKTTLRGGLQDGVDLLTVDNGHLSFQIIPTRGMGVWKGSYEGISLGWESPVKEPVHPSLVALNDLGGLGWLRGFNEWIVRCGLNSNGAPTTDTIIDNNGNESRVSLPLHGRIANLPARRVEVQIERTPPCRITVIGVVDETMMFGPALRLTSRISTAIGSNALTLSDEVVNLNRSSGEMQLLYHCNFGAPVLESGSRLVAPVRTVSPRDRRAQEGIRTFEQFAGPSTGFVEQVYMIELSERRRSGETTVLLRNRKGDLGVSMRFSLREMPCFTLWKQTASDGYVAGLEPATNYPNPKPFERRHGRVVNLEGGEMRRFRMTLTVHDARRQVRDVEREIEGLQEGVRPNVCVEPLSRFCPEPDPE